MTITVHKIDALVWEEIGVYLEKLDKIVEKLKMRVTKMVGQINPDVIDQQIQEIEEEMTQINREKRGKHGKARELAENDIVSLQEKLDELEALKQVAVKKLETIGQEQRDIEWLLHWGKEFAGRYNEAKYDDKRDALRILGIVAKVYRVEDTEHPRYEITTSISANIATTSHARWL